MNLKVVDLENRPVGEVKLSKEIFGLPIRKDILSRMVTYQLAKRRAGTHQARGISLVSGTTKKPFRQKGTGRARAGSLRAPQMRGGAVIFGPQVRDHSFKLPKKVRRLALKTALSAKFGEGKLVIVDSLEKVPAKTRELEKNLNKFGVNSALFVDGAILSEGFFKASSNLHWVDVLPEQGINVYDILRRDTLFLTKRALEHLEKRLSDV